MKYLILFFFIITSFLKAQNFNYSQKWKEIETLENQGNFKSNLTKIDQILNQAKKEKNTKQEIKALFYYSKVIWQTENDENQTENKSLENKVFDLFKHKIKSSNNIENAFYSLILANIYDGYFQQNRWDLTNITSTENKSEDFRTWNEKEFYLEIKTLFNNAFLQKELLKKEKIKDWEYLMTEKDKDELMPTLFDFFVKKYINTINNYNNISDETSEFNQSEKDKLTNELINLHQNDSEKSAFLYLKEQKIIENDNLEYQEKSKELEKLATDYKSDDYSVQILYHSADLIETENPKESFRIANKAINEFKKNKWTTNVEEILKRIKTKRLNFEFNDFFSENQNIPIKINHRNLSEFQIKIYDVTPNLENLTNKKLDYLDFDEDIIYDKTEEKFIRTENIKLKTFDDFKNHSTLIALNPLPKGIYKIEYKSEINSGNKSEIDSEFYIKIFNETAVLIPQENQDKLKYQIFDRNKGENVINQDYSIYEVNQNYENKLLQITKIKEVKSNQNGILELLNIRKNLDYYDYYLVNKKTGNIIFLTNSRGDYYNDEREYDPVTKIDFFLDRGIYRPGQKVYFKGILTKSHKNKTQILKNHKVNIELKNVNSEKVSQLDLTTNDFGSVFGEFILPSSGLNGTYYIQTDFGSKGFSVEEYKRPKFEVTFEKDFLKNQELFLDKSVKVQGKAISFAGSTISDANVKFRVTRKEVFLYRFCWFPTYNSPEEISNGNVKTKNDGTFEVEFIAEKSKKNKYKLKNRSYIYEVFADVTDINGETQSSNFELTIGDLPKKLELITKQNFKQNEFSKIKINSTDLNDVKVASQGNVIIHKLINPNEKIQLPNQDLDNVEYQIYDKKTFNEKLVNYLYSKESDKNKWKKETFYKTEFNTEKSDSVSLKNLKFDSGFYLIEAISMFKNDSIQTQKIIEIQNEIPEKIFFDFYTDKSSYQIGETAEITFVSNLENPIVSFQLKNKNKELIYKQIPLKNGKATEKIVISEDFLNGLSLTTFLIKHNTYSNFNNRIDVLNNPKDLQIQTKTFRDKIEPASKQNWELLVSGQDKDKILAEVLATMYDASLDKFKKNSFEFNPFIKEYFHDYNKISFYNNFREKNESSHFREKSNELYNPTFYDLNTFGFDFERRIYKKSSLGYSTQRSLQGKVSGVAIENMAEDSLMAYNSSENLDPRLNEVVVTALGIKRDKVAKVQISEYSSLDSEDISGKIDMFITPKLVDEAPEKKENLSNIKARTNLEETAFFFPNLMTDENGNVKISFTSPESLTKWKMLVLAHTKDLRSSTSEFYTKTQKELMIMPNVPRFLREEDKIIISAKIDNLSDKNLNGKVELFLNNSINENDVNQLFNNKNAQKSFSVEKGNSTNVSWEISVPKSISAVTWKIVAKAGDFSDGEQNILPILTNRMLITETLPISIKENEVKTFSLEKLKNNKSTTLENFNLSLQMTTNPIWNAVFSLPYLREYPYECSEQLFARFYGNVISSFILNKSPKIKKVFDYWNKNEQNISNLEKNPELKNILLEETPWIRDAQSETEKMKRISLFFDLNKMSSEFEQAQNKLIKRQMPSGGFSWFEGGKEDFYITNHILAGLGKLEKMLKDKKSEYIKEESEKMIQKMIQFLDNQMIEESERIKKHKEKIKYYSFSHYFYARSFWLNKEIPTKLKPFLNEYLKEIQKLENQQNVGQTAQNALILNRFGKINEAKKLVNSLKETSTLSNETGMYWKNNLSGWYFYEAPIENQSIAIEAFSEVLNDEKSVEEMKIWLLKNKQTNSWNSTKSTTEAVYSLMNFGKSYENSEQGIFIKSENKQIFPMENQEENSSGYFSKSWKNTEINNQTAEIHIEKKSPGIAFGGLFWQYFEDLDKITENQNKEIAFDKKLYIKELNKEGEILKEISGNYPIKIGDKITVKLVIKVSREMEYVHIKDYRASGFEPINVLSAYKFQNGIGYYESTKDGSTNFFISNLPKGIYVFEYDLIANNSGNFSNGITQLQSMYAPEMAAHSKGIRVEIK